MEKFAEWAKKNIRTGNIVVLETTTNVWTTYDIVAALASRVLVANAAEVGEIANAAGEDGQGRCQTPVEAADRRDRSGGVGAADACAGTACFCFVSSSLGEDQHHTCTCSAVQV